MTKIWHHPLVRSRYPLAVLAGLLLAAAFPKFGVAGLAWVAPALMVATALGKDSAERFRLGYAAGLAYYISSLYWLLLIPFRWHSIPLAPAAGLLALSAYLALYPATWVWLMQSPGAKVQSPESSLQSPALNTQHLLGSWFERASWAFIGAVVWVALEMIVARLFSGFPWNLLGASQYQLLPLIQIASFTGIYGVSFLVVWVSLSLLSAIMVIVRRPSMRSVWIGEIFLPLSVAVLVFSFGLHQLSHSAPTSSRSLKVTLVQPSVPQTFIWDSSQDDARVRDLIALSEQALTNQTDLLLWPEAGVPKLLRYDKAIFQAVTNLAFQHRVWMILGADDAEPRPNSPDPDAADYFNSSFLISPEGKLVDRYRKRSLVIFGEYIPLERWLPFMKWFTPSQGSFTPGDRAVQFELTDRDAKVSVLICFEDMFPHHAREYAQEDTDFLVNLTNNGWFGESAAQWQHAISALFRAVENGLPLVRCSNNGLSCWMDAQGRLRQVFRDNNGTVYGPGIMTTQIPLLAPGEHRSPTFYNQHGDWFGWSCVGIAAARLLSRVIRRFRT